MKFKYAKKVHIVIGTIFISALMACYSSCSGNIENQALDIIRHHVESENIDWHDQLDSLISGDKGERLSNQFHGELKLLAYQVENTLNINSDVGLSRITPVTNETLDEPFGSLLQRRVLYRA